MNTRKTGWGKIKRPTGVLGKFSDKQAVTSERTPARGKERLIAENGKHYWLQSDGSKRETNWRLVNGMAVLTSRI